MSKSKAYRALDVKKVNWERVVEGHQGQDAVLGLDIGKKSILGVLRWSGTDFERPWRASNPRDIRFLAERVSWLSNNRRLIVALEPTGTYGDVLRQALAAVKVSVQRVSPKMAKDFAEIFDGVPSQHDGKDAAVVAELAALGRSWLWAWCPGSDADQELDYWVDWMDGQRRQMMMWYGRLEALVSRHWPEATRIVTLHSFTLLAALERYGGPAGLAADQEALRRVQEWGRHFLSARKAEELVSSAATTVGVKQGPWDQRRLQAIAKEVLASRGQVRQGTRRLGDLAQANDIIVRQAEIVGAATACVLWVHVGDPRDYSCGAAYRKAMGLNLAERSSGQYQGKLKISKRGPATVRRWLYMAALRQVRQEPARSWYARQKKARRGLAKPALVGVMRKLPLALYQVGGRGQKFVQEHLFNTAGGKQR